MLNKTVKKYIDDSVLCWLATCNAKLVPNVSPKELFTYENDASLLIANIASPTSINNIRFNPNCCVSFVDILVQKGYKLIGEASIIEKYDALFQEKYTILTNLFSERFPIHSIISIKISEVHSIIAPSYFLFQETTEQSQIQDALKRYKIK